MEKYHGIPKEQTSLSGKCSRSGGPIPKTRSKPVEKPTGHGRSHLETAKYFPASQYVLLKVLRNKSTCFISENLREAQCHSGSSTLHTFGCTDGNGRLSSSFSHHLWRQKSSLLFSCVSLLPVTQLQQGFSSTLFIISDQLDLALVFLSLISSSVQGSCLCLHTHNSLHLS